MRRLVLTCSALLLAYVLLVIWCVQATVDVGVYSTYRPIVNRVNLDFFRPESREHGAGLVGSTIVAVAGEPVPSWPEYLRIVRTLPEAEYPESDDWPPTVGPRFRAGGVPYVRIDTVQPDGRSESVWVRVGSTPAAELLPSVLWLLLESGLFVLAAIVWWNRPQDRAARVFFFQTLLVIGAFFGGYHWGLLIAQPPLLVVYMISSVLLPAVTLHFYLLFPRTKPLLGRRPLATLLGVYGVPVLFLLAIGGSYAGVRWLTRGHAPADQVIRAMAGLRDVIFTYFIVAGAWYLASIVCLFHSLVTAADDTEKAQVRWLLGASIMALVPIGYSWYLANYDPNAFGSGGAIWPMFAASILVTLAFAVSITRYKLMRIDLLINFGLAYFLVSFLAALVYCGLVFMGMLLLGRRGPAGPTIEQALFVSGSALILSMGLDIARSRLRNFLDRRYQRDKVQLDRTLQQLGEAVEQLVDPPTLGLRLLQVTAERHAASAGAIYLSDPDGRGYRLAGHVGEPPRAVQIESEDPLVQALADRTLVRGDVHPMAAGRGADRLRSLGYVFGVPLSHEGRLHGFLLLGGKRDGDYLAEEVNLLTAFAPFAALALAGAEGHRTIEALNKELQSKVEKISEQQRRILALQQQLINQSRQPPAAEGDKPAAPDAVKPEPAIVGSSPSLHQVLALVPRVAASPSAVLIRGESGTGKEVLARAVHEASPRAAKPFVKVHCAALASGILESELFGHVKGAFTGAVRDKPGRFETADGGTLFLDEIGDVSLEVQTKLLRVLQEKAFERVGSNDPITVDVRLVAATHQNLEQLIRGGRFREDLYYRLNVITLTMPPLRERGDDVIELAFRFLRNCCQKAGKTIDQIDDDALLLLRSHNWPGNVRELENAIERAVVVANGPIITEHDLPEELRHPRPRRESEPMLRPIGRTSWAILAEREARHNQERDTVLRALESVGWNKTEAAKALGMARSTLLSRMKKFGLLRGRA